MLRLVQYKLTGGQFPNSWTYDQHLQMQKPIDLAPPADIGQYRRIYIHIYIYLNPQLDPKQLLFLPGHTTSSHHPFITSSHHHVIRSSHHHIVTSSHDHVITSTYNHTTMPSHHHIIISSHHTVTSSISSHRHAMTSLHDLVITS